MNLQSAFPFVFDFLPHKPVVVEVSNEALSSDGGLIPIRQFDELIGFTQQIADALQDQRDAKLTKHSLISMIRQRIYGIIADYEDQNDHEFLRRDAIFKMIAGRSPDDPIHLAGQSTISRFENSIQTCVLFKLRDVLFSQFIASFQTRPAQITIDIDAFDDPTHGNQQMTLFHGFYDQYQYLPIIATCEENDMVMLVGLRYGTCAASLGADDDLRYMVGRLRQVWPDIQIHVRGDCGFGLPLMYETCEKLGVFYTFGLSMNTRLKAASEELLAQAELQFKETGQKQRLFMSMGYQAETWNYQRTVSLKAESHAGGTNRRAVVSNRPGAWLFPEATYDDYTRRGESENRNKELKCDLHGDRLSDHRFMANFFRLYLHTFALNLLVRLRGQVSLNPSPETLGLENEPPVAAMSPKARRKYFNRRRQADVMGEGQPSTWRTRLIKVAVSVSVSCRRVVVKISGSWPYLNHFRMVSGQILSIPPPN